MNDDNVVSLFGNKLSESSESVPFDWEGYLRNVRTIQAGFSTLDAHRKCVAFNSVADAFCEVLEHVFSYDVTKDEGE